MLLTADSKGGVAIKKSGDIVSVFKHNASEAKGLTDTIIPEAIRRGGTHLDCFAGTLPQIYSKFGLVPIARIKFDRSDAPIDWNFERDGEPDIVFMAYDKQAAATTEKDSKIRGPLVQKAIENLSYSSYTEAVALQKAFVESKIDK